MTTVSTVNLSPQFSWLLFAACSRSGKSYRHFSNQAFSNCLKPDKFLIQYLFTAFESLMEQRKQTMLERPYVSFH